jgi:hypothetical protein
MYEMTKQEEKELNAHLDALEESWLAKVGPEPEPEPIAAWEEIDGNDEDYFKEP